MSELAGVIRNGIERGWPTEEIKNSLLNSGYAHEEIETEINKFSTQQSASKTPVPTKIEEKEIPHTEKFNPQNLSNYQGPPVEKEKKASNKMLIMIIVLLVLCVLAGAGLYLFG